MWILDQIVGQGLSKIFVVVIIKLFSFEYRNELIEDENTGWVFNDILNCDPVENRCTVQDILLIAVISHIEEIDDEGL